MLESSGTNRSCDLTIIFIDHRFRYRCINIVLGECAKKQYTVMHFSIEIQFLVSMSRV